MSSAGKPPHMDNPIARDPMDLVVEIPTDGSFDPSAPCPAVEIPHDKIVYPGTRPHDPIREPAHYKGDGLEVIDVIEAFDLNWRLGNAVKYLLRAGRKDSTITDLRKAQRYLSREIARLEGRKGSWE